MKFCSKCGAPIPKMKYCVHCGELLAGTAKFCKRCGAPNPHFRVSNDHPVVTPAPVETPTPVVTPAPVETPTPVVAPAPVETPVSPRGSETSAPETVHVVSDPQQNSEDSEEYLDYAEEPKKRGITLWIIICVLALGGLCAWYFLAEDKNEKKMVAQEMSEEVASSNRNQPDSIEVVCEEELNGEMIQDEPRVENTVDASSYVLGLHPGNNSFNAFMIHKDGRRFPFDLSLNYEPDSLGFIDPSGITNVIYYNPSAGTKVKMQVDSIGNNWIKLYGETGGKELIIQFYGKNPYSGDAWWGDFHQDVEMTLK